MVECISPSLERPARYFGSLPKRSSVLSISPLEQVAVLALVWEAGESLVSIAVKIGAEARKRLIGSAFSFRPSRGDILLVGLPKDDANGNPSAMLIQS